MKEQPRLNDTPSDVSILYELSLAAGQSLDLRTNCEYFLKALMARKEFVHASVWIKGKFLTSSFGWKKQEEIDPLSFFLVYANPGHRIREKVLSPDHPRLSRLKGKEAVSFASSEKDFSMTIAEKDARKGASAIFALRNLGLLELFSVSRETPYPAEELNPLQEVISKFAASLEGCLAHQSLIHEISERKQVEERHRRSEEKERRLAHENAFIAEIGRIVSSTLDIGEVYERFAKEVRKLIYFDRIVIDLINPEKNGFTIGYIAGVEIPGRRSGDTLPLIGSDDEYLLRSRSGLLLQAEKEEEVADRYPILLPTYRAGFQSMMSVPLISKDQVIGGLHFRSLRPFAYTDLDVKLAERVGTQIAGAIANARLFIEHKETEEALQTSEYQYRTTIDSMGDAIHMADDQFRLILANKALLQWNKSLGFETNIFGKRIFEVFPFLPARVKDEYQWVLKTGQLLISEDKNTIGGRDIFTETRKIPVLEDGKVVRVITVIRDITEKKQAAAEMLSLQEQLRHSQKMEAIGRLAGGIAHDFNNLLTVISGYSQLSLGALREGDPLRENITEIQRATERATALTRHLLAFSRRQILNMKLIDLNLIVQDLDKMLRRIIGEDIELSLLLAKDLWRVKSDPSQIEQVLLNLAVNARDAMPRGGRLIIKTENTELDQEYARSHIGVEPGFYVKLLIKDTGVGMPLEVLERVFEPFFTTKEKGKGTGLGLSTVYGIIRQSGGNIWVQSELGQGTIFEVYLPRTTEAEETFKPQPLSSPRLHGSETILLVEDEDAVRVLARKTLQAFGYQILEAANGEEALKLIEGYRDRIHLLLTDVVMPGMSGREVADRLCPLLPGMKVLYMTGYADTAIVHHGILEPGTALLLKPFEPNALAQKVRETLNR